MSAPDSPPLVPSPPGWLIDEPGVTALKGAMGVGKTTLARRIIATARASGVRTLVITSAKDKNAYATHTGEAHDEKRWVLTDAEMEELANNLSRVSPPAQSLMEDMALFIGRLFRLVVVHEAHFFPAPALVRVVEALYKKHGAHVVLDGLVSDARQRAFVPGYVFAALQPLVTNEIFLRGTCNGCDRPGTSCYSFERVRDEGDGVGYDDGRIRVGGMNDYGALCSRCAWQGHRDTQHALRGMFVFDDAVSHDSVVGDELPVYRPVQETDAQRVGLRTAEALRYAVTLAIFAGVVWFGYRAAGHATRALTDAVFP